MTPLYVYGTLRKELGETHRVEGRLYDLGWFPGLILGPGGSVLVERIVVDDIAAIDRYEGYREDDPQSLYLRRPYRDGFIYEFNRPVNPVKEIFSGDWLDYMKGRA
jgi:gamma-glutamylcyclotransferase (GGCT)/AIG2-like uncharacterized protein YtfP